MGTVHGPSFDDSGTSDATSDGQVQQGEGGSDASSEGSPGTDGGDAGGCTAQIAVVGGSGSVAFASVLNGGTWTGGTLVGSAATTPAVAVLESDFIAVFHAADDSLRSTGFASSWSPLSAVAAFGVRDVPALAAIGTKMHLAYQRKTSDAGVDDYRYFHAQYATSWDSADDPVAGPAGPSYGAIAPTAANIGGKFVIANVGGNGHVYAQTWDTTWQAPVSMTGSPDAGPGPGVQDFRPPITALEGSNDAMVVFVRTVDFKIMSVTHSAGGWSTPLMVDANAYLGGVAPFYPPTLVGTPGGHAVVSWRGSDGKAYFSLFNGASWSPPAPFLTPNPAIDSYPALAKGVCGADAVGAYVESGGALKLVRLTGSTWSAPVTVPGAGGLTSVAVATHP